MARHALSAYRAKRDFATTLEPRGAAPGKRIDALRFVSIRFPSALSA